MTNLVPHILKSIILSMGTRKKIYCNMENENVKLRRRKYSDVKDDFVYRTQFNKVRYLKKAIPIILITPLVVLVLTGWIYLKDGLSTISILGMMLFILGYIILALACAFVAFLIPYRHPPIGIHPDGIWMWRADIGDVGFIVS